jgi:hypothetical protein
MPQASSAVNRSLTVVLRAGQAVDREATRLVPRAAALVRSRIRARRGSSLAVRVPSIPRGRDLPALVQAVPAVREHVQDLARAPASVLRDLVDLAPVPVARRLPVKRRALRVPPVRQGAAAVSNIPRLKKAR